LKDEKKDHLLVGWLAASSPKSYKWLPIIILEIEEIEDAKISQELKSPSMQWSLSFMKLILTIGMPKKNFVS